VECDQRVCYAEGMVSDKALGGVSTARYLGVGDQSMGWPGQVLHFP
jgi:hypothetical protein